MFDYKFLEDIDIVQDLLELDSEEMAQKIGVSRMTLHNWKTGTKTPSNIEAFYAMAYKSKIRLNKIKEQLYREDFSEKNHSILFHGAKTYIEGELSLEKSKPNNDFGKGFYCGESLEQSAMFVASFPHSSLYIIDFDSSGLTSKTFLVNQEWMLAIAYFRGRLEEFKNSPIIKKNREEIAAVDFIIAPIADNRMFEIIDSFIEGEITDEQCKHSLSATNLGNQYVFVSEKALQQVNLLEHCYVSEAEKNSYLESKRETSSINNDKVKIARKQYRGKGKYIDEVLV